MTCVIAKPQADDHNGRSNHQKAKVMAMTTRSQWSLKPVLAVIAALSLAGCAVETVEIQNTQAARELKQRAQQPGSVYAGWRVFQDKCARCHGPAATGVAGAPDLLPRVRDMGPRQFVGLVLKRYDWGLTPGQTGSSGVAWDAVVDDVMERRQVALNMPAWDGEPRVTAHITDLYAYLWARAQGMQGPERPTP